MSSDSTHRTVTDAEKTTWNAKSNFSGNYNDLTNKPTIPSISGLATESYADSAATTAANKVKDDLLNGAGEAYDTLKELSDLIDDNQDAIKTLEDVAAGKANKTHSHAISDVSSLQSALDGKAASSHGTHVSYSTTAPVMDGTASVGTATTVARSDHKHPTDTSRAAKTDLDTHTANTTVHITSTERSNWNAAKTHANSAHAPSNAEKNQNAFSNIAVSGQTTVAADSTTDTVTFAGNNVSITTDATNDKVTFSVADASTGTKGIVQLTDSTSSTSTTTAATPKSVKSAYDLANTAKTNAATAQSRADSAYTLANGKVDSLSDLGITATAAELNYVDGVTSNVQTQLDRKVPTSRTVNGKALSSNISLSAADVGARPNTWVPSASDITSGILPIARGGTGNDSGYVRAGQKSGTTIGANATAEGWATTASGVYSHAEGNFTQSIGTFSHAEGESSAALGVASHAEGFGAQSIGKYSHAEGRGSIANGEGSHAEGAVTIATADYSHAQGKFNIEDTSKTYAHIVGNGTNTERSNAHTLDWDGNANFAGDVYVGNANANKAGKKLATEEYVSNNTRPSTWLPSAYQINAVHEFNYGGDANNDEEFMAIIQNCVDALAADRITHVSIMMYGRHSVIIHKHVNGYVDIEDISYQYALSTGTYYYKRVRSCYNNDWYPWEWENPPMALGVEYRTTERCQGKPVYKKIVKEQLANNTIILITLTSTDSSIVSPNNVVDIDIKLSPTDPSSILPYYGDGNRHLKNVYMYGNCLELHTSSEGNEVYTAYVTFKYVKD